MKRQLLVRVNLVPRRINEPWRDEEDQPLFFIVHLFCIPGPGHAAMMSAIVLDLQKVESNSKSVNEKSEAGHVNKIKISISKRFQHAAGLFELQEIGVDLVTSYAKIYPTSPRQYLLISDIIVSSLRGPPSLV